MVTDRWGFDEWAGSYDKDIYDTGRPDQFTFKDYDRVLDRIVEYCDPANNRYSHLLDIGIGTGNLAARFLPTGITVTGIDPSVKMMEICQRKFPDITVMPGHFLDIPLPPQSIDLIVSSYAFHHLTSGEKEEAVHEMKRVLKSGGRVVIADLMFKNPVERNRIEEAYRQAGRPEIPEEYADEFPGYADHLEKAFIKAGFTFKSERLTDAVWIICAVP